MPRKRVVIVLVDVDRERWEAAAFVRGISVDRFVREAVDHRISCHVASARAHFPRTTSSWQPPDVLCSCATDALCDRCIEDGLAQLKGVCACRADTWVAELAARRRTSWVPWPENSERVRAVALTWVEDLTRDPRLRERLAAELEQWAATRWRELQPPALFAMPSA